MESILADQLQDLQPGTILTGKIVGLAGDNIVVRGHRRRDQDKVGDPGWRREGNLLRDECSHGVTDDRRLGDAQSIKDAAARPDTAVAASASQPAIWG